MRKLTAKWTLHLLTIDQQCQRFSDSKSCLDLFNRDPSDFLRRLVTIHETHLLQENVPAHKSIKTMVKINELRLKLLPHLPYSPDLAPSNFYLFLNLKRWLQGHRFSSNEEIKWETDGYFGALEKLYYKRGIEMLEDRWNKCIKLNTFNAKQRPYHRICNDISLFGTKRVKGDYVKESIGFDFTGLSKNLNKIVSTIFR